MPEPVTPALTAYDGAVEDLLDRLAVLESCVSQLALDRAELRTQLGQLKKRVDLTERRLNAPKMLL